MTVMYTYKTKDICAKEITFEMKDEKVTNVHFSGGCDGNLKAIPILIDGWAPGDIVEKCKGITCGGKSTSCADQLSKAVKEAVRQISKQEIENPAV